MKRVFPNSKLTPKRVVIKINTHCIIYKIRTMYIDPLYSTLCKIHYITQNYIITQHTTTIKALKKNISRA